MDVWLHAILALLLLIVAIHVHMQLPRYTTSRMQIIVTRILLVLVGIGFGLTGTAYVAGKLPQLLTVIAGFGMVHVPAAIILFIKNKRGERKS